jgi:hypothetical protein
MKILIVRHAQSANNIVQAQVKLLAMKAIRGPCIEITPLHGFPELEDT